MLSLGLFFIFLQFLSAQDPFPETLAFYANQKILKDGVMRLSWNYTKTDIKGELHAKTQGWVGFGVSPNGGMDGSDVFVAKIVDISTGQVSFTDRYIDGRLVLIDSQQDWKLLGSSMRNGFLIVQFSRAIDTCDPNGQDRTIDAGTTPVIFAWNDVVVSNSDIENHGAYNRGTMAVQLISALNERLSITAEDAIETYDFSVDVTLPPLETYYHCHMFKIPDTLINNKRHLLRTITKFTPGNENYVHHWVAYQCISTFETSYLSNKGMPLPGHCFDRDFTNSNNPKYTWHTIKGFCFQVTLVWAIGGELVVDFPNDLGFPVGGSDREFTYFYLEIHYNNPEKRSGIVDQTSIQWNVTPRLRSTEIGVFTNGAISDWYGLIIPPRQDQYKLRYSCRSNCLNGLTKGQDITVFAVAPHTHTVGIGVKTTLIRNGTEIAYIDKNLNFDFNYQYFNFLQEPVVIKPGDEIETTCTYNTASKTTYVFGGFGASEEMCLEFLFYYPRQKNTGFCHLIPDPNNLEFFFTSLYQINAITFSKLPPDYDSLTQDLKGLSVSDDAINIVKAYFETSNQLQLCYADGVHQNSTSPRLNPVAIVEQESCLLNMSLKISAHMPLEYLILIILYLLLK